MIAALQPLAEMLALEANLEAALAAARRKLKAIQDSKAAAGSDGGASQSSGSDGGGDIPWNWTLFPILNQPGSGEAGGAALSYTPPPKTGGS